ncbi:Microtubule-nucleating Tub4p (gamma-tubulin) complex component [Elasticomyces elasticus]|uniref:Microtubule-nucleating Tub4p (Gamma-tubulin) complex component n=1 Tax=Elasticomyces elasticus TaxID=574655 RepID=A0AAN7W840_9PEZI|nr:Microtubule-nucleating Tub4p (gamma-tubulin) complex component [Elasticomyces elasticus]
MSSTREERVDNALQQLLERLVPSQLPDEDEAHADQRWDEANELARDLLDREPEPGVADDVNQAADLIKRRLVREGGGPERASAFGNLYSRLLSQPVLDKKWGILYFLWKLTEGEDVNGSAGARSNGMGNGTRHSVDGIDLTTRQRDGKDEQESVYDEAFARNGLPRMQRVDEVSSPRQPPIRERLAPGRPEPQPQAQTVDTQAEQDIFSGDVAPSEAALLRDMPFTLQGLSSTNLHFTDHSSLKLPHMLPVPLISLLHSLAEPSLLYRSLSHFVESSDGGLVGQSLRSAIGLELRSYLGLVATLEGQIRRALTPLNDKSPRVGLGKAGVTLKRCVIWTREATLGLRLMSMVVESAKSKKGGELISLIHNLATSHGDAFVYTFAERLLTNITRPFYNMLRAWVYDGELEDPYREFFVSENTDYEDSGATSVWESKYLLRDEMIPSIITCDFAHRVYLIGKSLNFIRHACHDSAWVEAYSKEASRELVYGDTANLGQSIDEAYKTVMARLVWLMEAKFALAEHLAALKKYLLLGQGDFVALLMESLASNLDRPANSQHRHTLTAQLEHAIRNSNAQFDSADVLRRLDARMLELSHGEIGWDVFTLEYRMDSPVDVIVTPWASKQYLKIFNFLWRVKRVEFALSTTWRRVQTGSRGVLAKVSDKLGADWKSARLGLAGMVHLVDQLQYYILFEVIEASWSGLQKAIHNPASGTVTLDTLISAHTAYLRSITRKGLLGGAGGVDFTAQLHELLKLMLNYRDAVDGLYSYSVAENAKREEMSARIETRTRAGRWGLTEADEDDAGSPGFGGTSKGGGRSKTGAGVIESPIPSLLSLGGGTGPDAERNMLEQLRQRLRSLEADFKARVNVLLGDLAYQPDVDMRFLGVVMNFNDVYNPTRRRRQKPESKEKADAGKA